MPSGLWWGFWKDYPKVMLNGREYAQIGDRLYTEHAVERFLPSGRRTIANLPVSEGEGGGHMYHEKARSIPPFWVEEAIRHGSKAFTVVKSELRTTHTLGDLEVVTTRDDHIVITVGYRH
jgi:filamentous hemagglutinin